MLVQCTANLDKSVMWMAWVETHLQKTGIGCSHVGIFINANNGVYFVQNSRPQNVKARDDWFVSPAPFSSQCRSGCEMLIALWVLSNGSITRLAFDGLSYIFAMLKVNFC